MNKVKIPFRIVFGQDMILPIDYIEDWRYIRQRKQGQIEKYVIYEKYTIIDYNYIVGDQVMVVNKILFK